MGQMGSARKRVAPRPRHPAGAYGIWAPTTRAKRSISSSVL